MADRLDEVIKIVLETQGREGIDALRKALASVGNVSADTVADTDKLLDSLAGLNETAAKAAQFDTLASELSATTQQLDDASRAALQLSLQLAETQKPSKDMLRTYKDVREEVARLEQAERKQAAAQAVVGDQLRVAGFDTGTLVAANRQLRAEIDGASAALQRQVGAVQQQSEATRKQKQATAEADEAFRRLARSGQVSAEALEAFRGRAAAAEQGTRSLGGEVGRVGSIFGKLRSLAAPVLAFLTFRTAASGVKALADVASQAENARRSLSELYHSQTEGNRAYDELQTLAKRNGLAFSEVLDQARKLKAFGLDPLNGSLQALIDQNAAAGGSNDDLAGKVLGLGQAYAKQKLQGEEILQLVERGVPVYELLAKATGKSVVELQKLSTQGKLGRDVIVKLYEEIGRQNDGAANRSLGTLSGLVAQVSARFLAFKQSIVEAGLGSYLKQQVQSLLDSTGGLDGLARRISDGIVGALESLKRLGQQIALVGKPVADATLLLAKHADTVLFFGKVYVALKLTRWANDFLSLARSQSVAAASMDAVTASAGRAGTVTTGLGKVLSGLPKSIGIGIAVLGVEYALDSIIKLNAALEYRKEVQGQVAAFDRSQSDLQQEQLRLGQQLQSLYQASAGVVIQSAEQVSKLTRDQAQDYEFALKQAQQYFGGVIREARATGDSLKEAAAADKFKALGEAVKAVETQLTSLSTSATTNSGIKNFVNAAVESFDKLASSGKSAKDAIKGAFDGLDLTSTDGIKKASELLDQVSIRSTDAARAVKAELSTALAAVSDEDLPKLQAAAEAAFETGSEGANAFGKALATINLTRLGVDVEAVQTGFSKVGRAVVDQFQAAIVEVGKLGLTATQRSEAIAQAFDNAFKKASTKSEIEALRAALQTALADGSISFIEFQKRIAETAAKLAELSGKATDLGADVKKGAGDAAAAVQDLGTAANNATKPMEDLGSAAKDTAQKAEETSDGAAGLSIQLGPMTDKLLKAYVALNAIAGSRFWSVEFNRVTAQWRAQVTQVDELTRALDSQAAALDPLSARLEALRGQYAFVNDDKLRGLAERQQRIQDDIDKQTEQARKERDDAEKSANAARQAAKAADTDASLSKPIADTLSIEFVAPSKNVATSASAAELEQAERLAGLVAPLVLQRIERSRSVSIRRRTRG